MRYALTSHARDKMHDLGVTEDDIQRVLDGPHTTRRSQLYSETTLISATVRGRRIILATVRGSQPLLIKTIMERAS